jgi:hypothetical protein
MGSLDQAKIYLPDHHEEFENVNQPEMSSSNTKEGIPPVKEPEASPIIFGCGPPPNVPEGEALLPEGPQR